MISRLTIVFAPSRSADRLMPFAQVVDQELMAKSSKEPEPSREQEALTPKMHDLIARFDAKDRRDEKSRSSNGGSKKQRRRGDQPKRAA
jgi:hypothetical protein